MRRPLVALVGRPNVGKSTLFNRLVGKRVAIVHDRPGVTRDRHYAEAHSLGRVYVLIDTGGLDLGGEDVMQRSIAAQVEVAVAEADLVVCVLGGNEPPTPIDASAIDLLRRSGKPVVWVANKIDSERAELELGELYRLGLDRLLPVSALHGRGIDVLEQELVAALGPASAAGDEEAETDDGSGAVADDEGRRPLRVAVVGRPNAGKSSLVNRLSGSERLVVDSRPGTTRDAIDSLVERRGRRYLLVDTAGLRRKAKVTSGRDAVEALCVLSAIGAIERAEVVVLLCDAAAGVAEQDAKILGLAVDRGRAVVVGLNKTDLLDRTAQRRLSATARDVLAFAPWAETCLLSAQTGRGVDRLLDAVDRAAHSFAQRVDTGPLNRFFETVLAGHPPPIQGGRAPRCYYITQARVRPPTFVVVTSHPDNLHFSYQRYVINAIRKQFGFAGTPIRVHYRRKDRRPGKRKRGG